MKFDEGSIILEEVLVSSCAGLVVLDHKSSTVKLVHYTAQVYPLGRGAQFLSIPHTKIAATCLRYLSLNLFDRYWLDYRNYSLLKYAAQNWGIHAREASTEPGGSSLSHKILEFLGQQENIIEVLTVACYGGLLLAHGADVNKNAPLATVGEGCRSGSECNPFRTKPTISCFGERSCWNSSIAVE